MSLASYQAPCREMTLGGTPVKFRGLSFNDLAVIMEVGSEDAEKLFGVFDQIIGDGSNFGDQSAQWLAAATVKAVPKISHLAIALAAVEDSTFDERLRAASSIPAPVQVEVLVAIGKLTFEEVGGVKKFFDSLLTMKDALGDQKASRAVKKTGHAKAV